MGIVFRQSIKNTIVTFIGALLGLVVVYISQKFLPQQELGFSRNLLNQAVICSQVVLMGIHTTLYVFVFRYAKDEAKRRALISISLLIPFILTLVFSLVYFLFREPFIQLSQPQDMDFARRYFAWLPVYTLLWGLMTVLEHYLSSQMKVALSNFMREVLLRLVNILLVVFYAYDLLSFDSFIAAGVLVHVIPVVVLYLIARRSGDLRFNINFRVFNREEYKSIFDFAFFHLLLNVSISLLNYIDSIMLAWLDPQGLRSVAIYFIAISVLSIYQIPYRALAAAATPALNKAYENGNMDEVRDLFGRSALNTLVVTLGMAALIIANLHNLTLILEEQYKSIGTLILVLMLGRTIDMATGLNNELLSVSKYYRYNFYLSVLLLAVIVTFNFLLIPRYGVYGAAASAAIGLAVFNIGKMALLWSKMKLVPFSKRSLTVIVAAGIALAVGYYLPNFPLLSARDVFSSKMALAAADATLRSVAILLIYFLLLVIFKASPDLNHYLSQVKTHKKIY